MPGLPISGLDLPAPGTMVGLSPSFAPIVIKGIKIFPDNPLRFDFIIDTGDPVLKGEVLKNESIKLIKYFLAALTVPEEDFWVNLSPYENDRIIPKAFGVTEMGRDLLAQDYLLKQITSSLIYPEEGLGKQFWDRIYSKAYQLFGTTDIPVNTFNKVWIVPEKAIVYENGDRAFVVESQLKVMLEEDYLSLKKNLSNKKVGTDQLQQKDVERVSRVSSSVVKEIILPEIEKEVNAGRHFANLRQIFHAMILASWFKRNLKESLFGRMYVEKNKVMGIDVEDKEIKEKIYQQYLQAFKTGVYNYIREDYDPHSQQIILRKYFSGGFVADHLTEDMAVLSDAEEVPPEAWNPKGEYIVVEAGVNPITQEIAEVPLAGPREMSAFSADQEFHPLAVTDFHGGSHAEMKEMEPLLLDGEEEDQIDDSGRSSLGWKRTILISIIAILIFNVFAPLITEAVTQPGEQFFANNNASFKKSKYYDETLDKTVDLTNPSEAGELLDRNLDDMLGIFVEEHKGNLVPEDFNLPILKGIFDEAGFSDSVPTFDDMAEVLRKEFSKRYQRFNGGQMTEGELDELNQLENEAVEWLGSLFRTTASFDEFLDEQEYMSLYRLLIENENYPDKKRTYVCNSFSEAMVFLGSEIGLREDVITFIPVYINEEGKKFPTPEGIGHVANLISTRKDKYMYDQGHVVSHPEIGMFDTEGNLKKMRISNSSDLNKYKNLSGKHFSDIMEYHNAWVELTEIVDDFDEFYTDHPGPVDAEESFKHYQNMLERIRVLESSPALKSNEDLRENTEQFKEGLNSTMDRLNELRQQNKVIDVYNEIAQLFNNYNAKLREADVFLNNQDFQNAHDAYRTLKNEIEWEVKSLQRDFLPKIKGSHLEKEGKALVNSIAEIEDSIDKGLNVWAYNRLVVRYNSAIQMKDPTRVLHEMKILLNDAEVLLKTPKLDASVKKSVKEFKNSLAENIENVEKSIAINNGSNLTRQSKKVVDATLGQQNNIVEEYNKIARLFNSYSAKLRQADTFLNNREIQKAYDTYLDLKNEIKSKGGSLREDFLPKIKGSALENDGKKVVDSIEKMEDSIDSRLNVLTFNRLISRNNEVIQIRDPNRLLQGMKTLLHDAEILLKTPKLDAKVKKNVEKFKSSLEQNIKNAEENVVISKYNNFLNRLQKAVNDVNPNQRQAKIESIIKDINSLLKENPPGMNEGIKNDLEKLKKNAGKFDNNNETGFLPQEKKSNNAIVDFQNPDMAMIPQEDNLGGIDLTPANLNIQTQGKAIDFNMPVDLQGFENTPINGFSPIILQIVPVSNIQMLLGINEEKEDSSPPGDDSKSYPQEASIPVDRYYLTKLNPNLAISLYPYFYYSHFPVLVKSFYVFFPQFAK